jgi:hypothetical protein
MILDETYEEEWKNTFLSDNLSVGSEKWAVFIEPQTTIRFGPSVGDDTIRRGLVATNRGCLGTSERFVEVRCYGRIWATSLARLLFWRHR